MPVCRYEEAQSAYSRMHELEDEASRLAREVGCVACVLGDPACAASDAATDPEEAAAYLTRMQLPSWPQGG
jgi:hypothetical protein